MSESDLKKAISENEKEIEVAEKDLKNLLEDLQSQYNAATEKKEKIVEDVKKSGLSLMKSILKANKAAQEEEL